jgi:GT2 family glycosyltransferase
MDRVEVRVYDNGAPQYSRATIEFFKDRFQLIYTLNPPGHGLGYSLNRGEMECLGERIVEINDDALVPPDLLKRFDLIFDSDPSIGVVGVRAIEDAYCRVGQGIGVIDAETCEVVGNFDLPATELLDVEHVYGFCYAYTRDLLELGGRHDRILLSKDYSSGNRLETDHCLTAKRLGFRVVYDGRIAVHHLARPRADMSERSLKWSLNHTRNTLYLFLKHFGPFGKGCLALRFAFFKDVGILSALRHPGKDNWVYFLNGIRARASAFGHYFLCFSKIRRNGR